MNSSEFQSKYFDDNTYIKVYSNVLENRDDIINCENILYKSGWFFGFKTNVNNENHIPFWKLPLGDNNFFTEYLFEEIKNKTGKNFEILEVYCNGQTYGQDGSPHIDDVHGETHTFLYYANTMWNLTSGGQTVFLVNNQKIEVDPMPNWGVLFTTNILHYGEAYNQSCRGLRMSVCYKLKEIK